MPEFAIIGGGASGVFCAIKLLDFFGEKANITIYEKFSPLKTLLPTGNGRCNLAYNEYDNKALAGFYPRGEKFLYSVFSRYGLKETLLDFEKLGIKTYVQPDNRIFPVENSAAFVKKKFLERLTSNVKFIKKEINAPLKGYNAVILSQGLKFKTSLIEKYGHKISPVKPVLTGLKIAQKEFSSLKGVSFNNVLFTDEGITGPYIYEISSINACRDFPYEIKIPLLNTEELEKRIKENPKKLFKNVVCEFVPKSLAEILIKEEKQCANVSKKEIISLENLVLKAVSPDSKGAITHCGGVPLNEIDKNYKSKIASSLWIIGEVVDIDGLCGGFNLQHCWASAAIAAEDIANRFL